MQHSISPSDIPAIHRHRGAVLRALKLALLRFDIERMKRPDATLEHLAVGVLRELGAHGVELRRRRPLP